MATDNNKDSFVEKQMAQTSLQGCMGKTTPAYS